MENNLQKLSEINENLILNFPIKTINNYLINKVNSSLNALDNMNEMQMYFIHSLENNFSDGELIMRLYGLLQGLFVGIDALYDLAYGITNSKNVININQNSNLRELKYIRNDVVGHPTHRVYDNSIGYCILKKEEISKVVFSYSILNCSKDECVEEGRTVNLLDCLESFYVETNKLLMRLSKLGDKSAIKLNFSSDIISLIEMSIKMEFKENFAQFKNKYQEFLEENERILWRCNLVDALLSQKEEDSRIIEFIQYMIHYELEKLNLSILDDSKKEINYIKIPYLLKSFYRFIKNNEDFIDKLRIIHDATHPLFKLDLNFFLNNKKVMHNKNVSQIFMWMKKLYHEQSYDIIYLIGSKLKNYKR